MSQPHPPVTVTTDLWDKFSSRYKIDDETGCWNWIGNLMNKGYGRLSIGSIQYRAHRLSFEIHNAKYPGDHLVCHTCDNRRCVNPEHLYLGDAAQNAADKIARGRGRNGSTGPLMDWFVPVVGVNVRQRAEYCIKCSHHRKDDYPAYGKTPSRCRPCTNRLRLIQKQRARARGKA